MKNITKERTKYDLSYNEIVTNIKNETTVSLVILAAIIMIIAYNRALYFLSDFKGISSILFMLMAYLVLALAITYFLYDAIKKKKLIITIILLTLVAVAITLLVITLVEYKEWFSIYSKYKAIPEDIDHFKERKEALEKLTNKDLKISTISFVNYFIIILFSLIYTVLEGKEVKED